jgi:hypothetical protein
MNWHALQMSVFSALFSVLVVQSATLWIALSPAAMAAIGIAAFVLYWMAITRLWREAPQEIVQPEAPPVSRPVVTRRESVVRT